MTAFLFSVNQKEGQNGIILRRESTWLENSILKESLLFRGAMEIERPQMVHDAMVLTSQLEHYNLFYGTGDDVQLGKFVMEQIQRPSAQAREFLDPEKVGAAYDKDAADFAVMFIESLSHTKGTWAGKPFELIDWQEQIIRDLFGVLKPNGYTRTQEVMLKQSARSVEKLPSLMF